ncbi:hypothetical protein [Marinactinospora rubrisoli]|uniref:Uncharacterized protein n=1 Tax=Marinactinospora rubrisoli TaxID=2715399 RepID=A0ABW2KQB4_9ACTN
MSAARSSSSASRFAAAATSRRKGEDGATPTRGATAGRTAPVRITIDLTPADYRRMKEALAELARLSDIPTLPHSEMWRAALRRIADDPELRADLAEDIVSAREDQ